MKILQVTEPFKMDCLEKEDPTTFGEDELLVGVKRVGVCGSDIHIYSGHNPFAIYPRIIGHEIAGIVEAVGDKVANFKVGDHIVLNPAINCGECDACKRGHINTCSKLEVLGVHRDGGFCSKFVAKESWVYKIPQDMSWETAILVEPFTIGANVTSRVDVRKDDRVLVVGSGVIGSVVLMTAKMMGAVVTVADIAAENLEKAKELGADNIINTKEVDLYEEGMRITDGDGFTVVIDAACVPSMFMSLLECAAIGGRIGVLGFSKEMSEINQFEITRKELTIAGSRLSNKQFARVIDWFASKQLNPEGIVNSVYSFEDAAKVIEEQYAGKLGFGKNIISFD